MEGPHIRASPTYGVPYTGDSLYRLKYGSRIVWFTVHSLPPSTFMAVLLSPGASVLIAALCKFRELNGKTGVLGDYDADVQRWQVDVQGCRMEKH